MAELEEELLQADRLGKLRDVLDPASSVRYAFERSLEGLNLLQRIRFAALGLPTGPDWPRPVIERLLVGISSNLTTGATLASDHLDALATLSLVTLLPYERSADPRVRLHPLLRELAAGEWRAQPEDTLRAGIAAQLAAVHDLAVRYAHDFTRLAVEEELIVGAIEGAASPDVELNMLAETVDLLTAYLNVGGHWRLGMRLLELQLEARRRLRHHAGEGATLNNLGNLADNLGDVSAAPVYYEQALSIADELGDLAAQSESLLAIGISATRGGQLKTAHDTLTRALDLARASGHRAAEGSTLNALGELARIEGRWDHAPSLLEAALVLAREIGDQNLEGGVHIGLGQLAQEQGRTTDAQAEIQYALNIFEATGARQEERHVRDYLAAFKSDGGVSPGTPTAEPRMRRRWWTPPSR